MSDWNLHCLSLFNNNGNENSNIIHENIKTRESDDLIKIIISIKSLKLYIYFVYYCNREDVFIAIHRPLIDLDFFYTWRATSNNLLARNAIDLSVLEHSFALSHIGWEIKKKRRQIHYNRRVWCLRGYLTKRYRY